MKIEDAEKLAGLWVSVQDDVATFVSAFIRNPEDAKDVLQLVAMKVVRKFEMYNQARPFKPWAIGVAKREIQTYLRRQSSDRHVFSDDLVQRIAEVVEQRLLDDDVYREALRDCVEQAQPRGREALQLHYGKGLKTAQVAEQLNMGSGATRMLLCRVREALRQCIEERLAREGIRP